MRRVDAALRVVLDLLAPRRHYYIVERKHLVDHVIHAHCTGNAAYSIAAYSPGVKIGRSPARNQGMNLPIDVVHAAIVALERQEFLRGLNGDYQHLRGNTGLWEQYLAERHEWDNLA